MIILGKSLPPLGWQHARPYTQWYPIADRPDFPAKPRGGLWTAPVVGDGTAWSQWCRREEFGSPDRPVTRVVPDPDARVYLIDGPEALQLLAARYPLDEPPLHWAPMSWEKMAADVDAAWLTEEGEHSTRFSSPGLYGWDCETVLWLQPRFTIVDQPGGEK